MNAQRGTAELEPALAVCRATIQHAYARADALALAQQRRHRRTVDVVAVSGTCAVIAGIAPLSEALPPPLIAATQAVAATTAILAVALGIWSGFQRRWLLERHRAERLRLLEFAALLRYAGGEDREFAAWQARIEAEVAALRSLSEAEMHRWLRHEATVPDDPHPERAPLDAGLVFAAARDYRVRRLEEQERYFFAKAARNERWDERTRSIAPLVFFISVGATVPAAVLRLLGHAATTSIVFATIAAAAAALAVGLGILRSAHEFARNGIRFRAKATAMGLLRERLAAETAAHDAMRDLWYAERVMEAEHREWLRLMMHAQWYG